MVQVSERQFFADYVDNTTQMELYNDRTANIFLNNNSAAHHFIRLGNDTQFREED